MIKIPCVLFAGGKSSRMQSDKSLLPFGSHQTLTHYQTTRLQKIFSKIYISTKDPSKFPKIAVEFIVDKDEVFAPTAGFVAAFEKLRSDFFVLGVDMPFVSKEAIEQLVNAHSKKFDATLAEVDGKLEPLCGVYSKTLQKEFEAMLQSGNHALRKMLSRQKIQTVAFKKELFFNLNYPHEYQKAKELYAIMKEKI